MDFDKYKTMWPEEYNELKTINLPAEVKVKNDVIEAISYAIREDGFYEFTKFKDQKFLWYYRKLDKDDTESVLMKIRAFCGKKNGKLMVRYIRLNEKGELKLENLQK